MNPNRPSSSDENLGFTPSEVEQRLKQLQPRMPNLDIEAILEAERNEHSPAALVDRAPLVDHSGSTRFARYALTWASGAVAGALLTVALMAPWHIAGTQSTDKARLADSSDKPALNSTSNSTPTVAGQARSPQPTEDTNSAVAIAPQQWSRNEWLISAWLVETRGALLNQQRPLMAGDYAFQSESRPTNKIAVTVGAIDLAPDDTGSRRSLDESDVQPALSTNTDRLLRELLGEPIPTRM